jgi:hypothetical protein
VRGHLTGCPPYRSSGCHLLLSGFAKMISAIVIPCHAFCPLFSQLVC